MSLMVFTGWTTVQNLGDMKDLSNEKIDLDFIRGYKVDRGENPNSFYMTDEDRYESKITVQKERQVSDWN